MNDPLKERNRGADQWDDWLDRYVSENLPELQQQGEAPPPRQPDHSGGWYTGKRKNGAKRRSVTLPSQEPPEEETPPAQPRRSAAHRSEAAHAQPRKSTAHKSEAQPPKTPQRRPAPGFYEPPEQKRPARKAEELPPFRGLQPMPAVVLGPGAVLLGFLAAVCCRSGRIGPGILLLILALAAIAVMLHFAAVQVSSWITEPVAAITDTTKRIASGSYGVQIEKQYGGEIGELANTINDMSRHISEAEKMKSEFISSVSHELRTPLTAINGWGETLLRGEVSDQRDVQKGMAIIVSEARRLTKMVEELLEFSRIEDGRFTLRIEQIDLKAELEDAVYTYREFFRKKGITLEYHDCEEEFPPMPGDPERLRQVFSNLLDNAAKHGGSGKRITVSIFPDGAYAAIRIRDYGSGIPEAELPLVKQKFYKGSSKARGSGIGLAVCDEIAIRHNGSLEIANAVGGGCAVTLRLPIHSES